MGKESRAHADEPSERVGETTDYEHWFGFYAELHDLHMELRGYEVMPCPDAISALSRLQSIDHVQRRITAFKAKYGVDTEAASKVLQRREKATTMRDDSIIVALLARKVDPMQMPPAPLGNKPWPLREEISSELKLSNSQVRESFTRLRKAGRMSLHTPKRSPRS